MKIKNVRINNFGNLSDKDINFGENINIIKGQNESGKSTLQKFIIGMFYGLSKNKDGNFIPDVQKYEPWGKEDYSGKLLYMLDNNEQYEIFRDFKKKSPKIFNSKLENITNNFNIEKQSGNQFFIEQTNIDETLFKNTVLVEQQKVQLDEKEQVSLVQKMANLMGTGDDNTSLNTIMSKLNKKQLEEIGSDRSQDRPINIIEKKLEQIKQEKQLLQNYKKQENETQDNIALIEQEIEKKQQEIMLLKELQEIRRYENIEKEKLKATNNLQQNYDNKINELKRQLDENNQELEKKLNTKKQKNIYIILAILFIIIGVSCFIINKIASLIPFAFSVFFIGLHIYKQNENKNRIKKLKKQNNVENLKINNEIDILEDTKKNFIEQLNTKKQEISLVVENKLYEISNKFKDIHIQEKYKNSNEMQIEIDQNKLNNLKVELHTLKLDNINILTKLEELASLEEKESNLQLKKEFLQNKNEIIEIVKQELQIAAQEMKENVTPKFTQELSKIMERISQGKYRKVKFDDEQGIIVEAENGDYISAKKLSIGTIDQLYLSLRLSTANAISQETLPIILDEAFAYYDDNRLENILKYLVMEYEDRQILIFTCTNREEQILNKNNIQYTYVQL